MAKRAAKGKCETPGHRIDKEELDTKIGALLGRKVEGYTSQRGTDYRYGYARVNVPGLGVGGGLVTVANGRMEGDLDRDSSQFFSLPETDPAAALAKWIANILRSGRTVECGPGVHLQEWRRTIDVQGQNNNVPLTSLVEQIDAAMGVRTAVAEWNGRGLNLSPDYQRGYVWTDEQASHFVGHWLEGGAMGRILVQRFESQKNVPPGAEWWELPAEVIDGQQRLRSIYRWVKGKIKAEISDGRRWAYRDTNEIDRFGLDVVLTYVDMPRTARLAFYVRLNRGGTIHTEEEIQRVREMLAKEMA